MSDHTDPAKTLRLLEALEKLGFGDSAFSILHHFAKPTVAEHRHYCQMLCEEEAQFRTNANPLVQRRLEMVLAMYQAGGFSSGSPSVFEHLANAAVIEVPHDRRPLSEQHK